MAKNSIRSEEVYEAVKIFMSDGQKRSFAEIGEYIKEKFGANDNQVSGLLHRMHSSKKILTKLKNEKGYYVAYGTASVIVGLADDLEKLIINFRKTLVKESLNTEVPIEDIGTLRNVIPKLESIYEDLQQYNRGN